MLYAAVSFGQFTITKDGVEVTDGQQFVYSTANTEADDLQLVITNNSSKPINLYMKCYEMVGTNGSQFLNCFFQCIMGIRLNEELGPLGLDAGASTNEGAVHFHNEDSQASYIKYSLKIYEEGQEEDALKFHYIYDLSSGVDDLAQNTTSVFPNPATDFFKISSPEFKASEYSVTDLSGRVVLQGHCGENSQINTKNMSKGLYFVNIKFDDTNVVETHKLIVK